MTIPTPPSQHGLNSKTFKIPPLDGSLTLPQIYDWHAEHSPDHSIFRYESDGEIVEVKWPTFIKAVHGVARFIISHLGPVDVNDPRGDDPPVVGILAVTDSITYLALIIGIMRAGYQTFPLSPRNSAAAVTHLLAKTNVRLLLVSEGGMTGLAKGSMGALEPAQQCPMFPIPTYTGLVAEEGPFDPLPSLATQLEGYAIILHSSGSTAFPKPIRWTHHSALDIGLCAHYGTRDICGEIFGSHAIPMFHGLGIFHAGWVAMCGITMAVFKPTNPPIFATPETVFNGIVAAKSTMAFVVPTFVEAWAKDPAKVPKLAQLEALIYSGGPINEIAGDKLMKQGVKLVPILASSENGAKTVFVRKQDDPSDWMYMELTKQGHPHLKDYGDGTYELILVKSPAHTPRVFNTKVDGVDAYATSDLLVRHPTKPHLWKVFGRADDQIMLSTGEKTNPGPLESILHKSPYIGAAVIFGRGRFQNGVLVEPKKEYQFNPTDEAKLAEYRNAIWPAVEEANAYAPQHSRLFKEMIIVAPPSKTFTYTGKGTVRRQAVINDFEEEIDALYKAIEESSQVELDPPADWELPTVREYVHKVVAGVMVGEFTDEDDLFQRGCDSLQATRIRNTIGQALRSTPKAVVRKLPADLVYANPTVVKLAKYVSTVATTGFGDATSDKEEKIREMQELINKLTTDLPTHVASQPASETDTILLTGSTGTLGANILSKLASSPSISRVFALNRKSRSSTPIKDRQLASLKDRGLTLTDAQWEKVVLLEGDLSAPGFGLDIQVYQDIQSSVTHVIHNAWPVNFNMSLSSFEPLLRSVRTIVDLALSSPKPTPARVMFTSSIAVVNDWPTASPVPETSITDPAMISNSGYAQSKWVAERILEIAGDRTSLRPVVVRVGQLSGGVNGCWNPQEWFPSIVRSGEVIKCLPGGAEETTFLGVHVAASALVEFRNTSSTFLHLANPKPTSFASLMQPISTRLNVPVVTYHEWLAKLEKNLEEFPSEAEAIRKNPALKLLGTFQQGAQVQNTGRDVFGLPRLNMTNAVHDSVTLQDENQVRLGANDVEKWLSYWKGVGHLDS